VSTLKGKKVLVTGGNGFIGPNLVEDLLSAGATVSVLDLPDTNWNKYPKSVGHIKADILEPSTLKGIFKDTSIIYHLAARTDIDGKTVEDYKVNYKGTSNLVKEAATSKSVERFVFYSTQLVVGLFNETRFIDETEPYKTKTPYGQSKIEGEKVVIRDCKAAIIQLSDRHLFTGHGVRHLTRPSSRPLRLVVTFMSAKPIISSAGCMSRT